MLDQQIVLEVVRTTFEEMTFLDVVETEPGEVQPEPGPILYLPYSQPRPGSLALSLPKEIKFLSAENIYGESWKDLTSNQIDDSLLEMLNVLVGRLLTLHFGEQSGYVMGLPTVIFDEPGHTPGTMNHEYFFRVDDFHFHLTWSEVNS